MKIMQHQFDNWSFLSLQRGVYIISVSLIHGPWTTDYRNIEITEAIYPGWHPDKAPQGETPEVHLAGVSYLMMLTDQNFCCRSNGLNGLILSGL